MLEENVKRRLTAVAVQLALADKKGVSNVAKSSYYRSSAILTCTVIEGLIFEIAKRNTASNGHIIDKVVEHEQKYRIPKSVFSTPDDLFLCQRLEKNLLVTDSGVTFAKLNVFLKNKKLVSEKEYKELEYVRKERNKLHLQSISKSDTGYTKARVVKVSKPLAYLVSRL